MSVSMSLKPTITFNSNNQLTDLSLKNGSELTAAIFGLNNNTIKEVVNSGKLFKNKHGMFASVPIICQDQDCKYKDICTLDPANRQYGQRCPMEIAAILSRYEQWCAHFGIDTSQDEIDPKDLVDATLIKDLVVVEIQMLRAENRIALNGDFMSQVLSDIDKRCNPYYGEDISPETSFLLSLQDKKIKILNQLNSTRKDKAQDKRRETVSDEAIKIFQKIKEMEAINSTATEFVDIIDADFDDEGNILIDDQNDVVEENDEVIKEVIEDEE